MKNKRPVIAALAMITQFGLSFITPVLLCILGAMWLKNKFGLGNFTVVAGIILGVGAGVMSMIKMLRQMSDMSEEGDR